MSAVVERFKITRAAFEDWAQSAFGLSKPPTGRAIAQTAQISKSTVAKQLKSDDVDARFVIDLARGLGREPLDELSRFGGYELLKARVEIPSIEEQLTVVSFPDLLTEILRRFRWSPQVEESIYPLGFQTWNAWFSVVAPHATLASFEEILGLTVASISRNHRRGNWSVAQVLAISTSLNLNPHMALVASAHLSLEEAGLPATMRKDAIRQATDEQLQTQLSYLAPHLTGILQRQSEDLYRGLSNDRLA